jgi:hypothetical protein
MARLTRCRRCAPKGSRCTGRGRPRSGAVRAEGVADGSIRPTVRPEPKARELLALTIGAAYLFVLDTDQTDPSQLLQAALDDIESDD